MTDFPNVQDALGHMRLFATEDMWSNASQTTS